uniref:Uncharacterized protein n=1 Tax=Arundo donax TaxID=35708 RepID=A0A0A9FXY3_ARUDO
MQQVQGRHSVSLQSHTMLCSPKEMHFSARLKLPH